MERFHPERNVEAVHIASIMEDPWRTRGEPAAINSRLMQEFRHVLGERDRTDIYNTIGAVRLLEQKGIAISQPVWQLAYIGLIYIIEKHGRGDPGMDILEVVRIYILEKLKRLTPTMAAKKITKFIRSAADRVKAAKIIQKHYKEYLYRPDVYLKSAISKPARLRFK
jgi:hypothetical protein